MQLSIPVVLLRVVCFAMELYTSITPNRWCKIQYYTQTWIETERLLAATVQTCLVSVYDMTLGVSLIWKVPVLQILVVVHCSLFVYHLHDVITLALLIMPMVSLAFSPNQCLLRNTNPFFENHSQIVFSSFFIFCASKPINV